jgi:hypothetical protein
MDREGETFLVCIGKVRVWSLVRRRRLVTSQAVQANCRAALGPLPCTFLSVRYSFILRCPRNKPGWLSQYNNRRVGWKLIPVYGLEILLFFIVSGPALWPTQRPIHLVVGVKRPGLEADHSHPSNIEVKNELACTSTRPYVFLACCLIKHGDNSPPA